jgi:hypothetical protein
MDTNATALDTGSLSFNNDSRVITHGGKIFVLERPYNSATDSTDGKLNCLDPTSGVPISYGNVNLAIGSNPYDIAFIDSIGYIAQYGLNYLQIFNAKTCALGGTIPLPNVLDSMGLTLVPDASQNAASIKAGTLYFQCVA